jgi:hypothetical protein
MVGFYVTLICFPFVSLSVGCWDDDDDDDDDNC